MNAMQLSCQGNTLTKPMMCWSLTDYLLAIGLGGIAFLVIIFIIGRKKMTKVNLKEVSGLQYAKLQYVGDSHNVLHSTDENKHKVGQNSVLSELEKKIMDVEALAKIINKILYENPKYDSRNNYSNCMAETIINSHREWIK